MRGLVSCCRKYTVFYQIRFKSSVLVTPFCLGWRETHRYISIKDYKRYILIPSTLQAQ